MQENAQSQEHAHTHTHIKIAGKKSAHVQIVVPSSILLSSIESLQVALEFSKFAYLRPRGTLMFYHTNI